MNWRVRCLDTADFTATMGVGGVLCSESALQVSEKSSKNCMSVRVTAVP
jgi:hypothetical protein